MKHKGFTLIEVLVVISIVLLILGIIIPAINSASSIEKNKIEERMQYPLIEFRAFVGGKFESDKTVVIFKEESPEYSETYSSAVDVFNQIVIGEWYDFTSSNRELKTATAVPTKAETDTLGGY